MARPSALCLLGACCVLLLAAAPAQGQAKRALLVGIDDYPCVRDGLLKLRGAPRDVSHMRLLLRSYGFADADVVVLMRSRATSKAIRAGMDRVAGAARTGDVVLFYFSGRGSAVPVTVAKGARPASEPTLVPFDGQAGSAAADIRMAAVEKWAASVAARGAAPVVILDASYANPATKAGQGHAWLNIPRVVKRQRVATPRAYRGPGVCLAACAPGGRAYEWEMLAGQWCGYFTEMLWSAAAGARARGRVITYADALDRAARGCAGKSDWMPYQRPCSPSPAEDLGQPVFGPSTPAAPKVIEEVRQRVVARERADRTLRVVIDVPDAIAGVDPLKATVKTEERDRIVQAVQEPIRAFLSQLDGVALEARGRAHIDRVLSIAKQGDGTYRMEVQGDEVDGANRMSCLLESLSAAEIRRALASGIADYLQTQAYYLRLFRLTERDEGQTLRADWTARAEKASYRRKMNGVSKDLLRCVFRLPAEGRLYVLDQDEYDGIVQLMWPSSPECGTLRPAGLCTLPGPGLEMEVDGRTQPGTNITRAVFVQTDRGVDLPSLEPPGGRWRSNYGDAGWLKAVQAHLRALLDAIETGRARWSARSFTYEVR